jgi:hypothetical protein
VCPWQSSRLRACHGVPVTGLRRDVAIIEAGTTGLSARTGCAQKRGVLPIEGRAIVEARARGLLRIPLNPTSAVASGRCSVSTLRQCQLHLPCRTVRKKRLTFSAMPPLLRKRGRSADKSNGYCSNLLCRSRFVQVALVPRATVRRMRAGWITCRTIAWCRAEGRGYEICFNDSCGPVLRVAQFQNQPPAGLEPARGAPARVGGCFVRGGISLRAVVVVTDEGAKSSTPPARNRFFLLWEP